MINTSSWLYKFKIKFSKASNRLLLYILVIGLGFLVIYPLLQMIVSSITHFDSLGKPNSLWIPAETSSLLYKIAFNLTEYWSSLAQTLLYASLVMLIQIFVSAITGYSFARLSFKGSNILFLCVLLTIIVPPQVLMLPQYLHFRYFDVFGIIKLFTGSTVNMLNKPTSIFFLNFFGMGLKSGLFIFIFRQFFKGLPKELEEAALIDGCGHIKTFYKIMMPIASPAILTVAVFSFVWNYGDTYLTSVFYRDNSFLANQLVKKFTDGGGYIAGEFADLTGLPDVNQASPLLVSATQNAGLILFLIPLLILYFIIQRRFVESFERSGIVG